MWSQAPQKNNTHTHPAPAPPTSLVFVALSVMRVLRGIWRRGSIQ